MMSTNTTDMLRKRRAEVHQADDARNSLLDDLLQKVDDMQKTMDRNAFVMVLIDGDCMTVCVPPSLPSLRLFYPMQIQHQS